MGLKSASTGGYLMAGPERGLDLAERLSSTASLSGPELPDYTDTEGRLETSSHEERYNDTI